MKTNSKKVIIGMSGGIDSSAALILLKNQGFEPIGVTLKLPVWQNKTNTCRNNTCCTPASIKIAKSICKKFNTPYLVIEAQKEFQKEVVNYFLKELKKYHTPNPCLICNRNLKFHLLIALAKKMKIPYVATGHYAQIKFNPETNLYELYKGKDKNKDQSYSLSFLKQEQLKYLVLPLGKYLKTETYQLIRQTGLPFFEKQKESQNFCFVSNQALPEFIKHSLGTKTGKITDLKGKVLGEHQGLYFYTIGQRKRLKLNNGPYYVVGFDIKKNILLVSKKKKDLYKKEAILSPLNFISRTIDTKSIKISAQIRYHSQSVSAWLYFLSKNKAKIVFQKPQKSVTPGQFCVFYNHNKCLGAGIIN